ncbi:3'(2'),5'-bisphosphate nucleotidase CysQ [Hoyosella sp. G463]|uniref:3'(2'),5'-bisphosphate nucleotidase CysQ n=1 Tax=Lolliginicoccus lacisalsi TaxID=2742202 RepID=A0A927PL72_9ACTN|nr:3'(2'),5'-bisphosphate nucleotidase CysQ [Lolliginicoccus lacisalsi]MBD8505131.1 3'(2'),5'-bisphosphate nucleotidase CysQ [Lolliginicoccus lacisalsi]
MAHPAASDPGDLVAAVLAIAREAGDSILDVYRAGFDVDLKADGSPLTAADLASHHCLSGGLRGLDARVPVLSEEDGLPAFAVRQQWSRYWLIDPLDGTKEFVQRNGDFTVNVALIEMGAPVLGVVHAPVRGTSWFAAAGAGAWKQQVHEDPVPIATAPMSGRPAGAAMRIVASRNHRGAAVDALLERLPHATSLSVGSSLKLCMVAEGAADLYPRLGPTSEWDTAAGQCVVEQAGGAVTTVDLEPLRYNTKDGILNPHFVVVGDMSFDWGQYLPGAE